MEQLLQILEHVPPHAHVEIIVTLARRSAKPRAVTLKPMATARPHRVVEDPCFEN